jgi:hypothetical protein
MNGPSGRNEGNGPDRAVPEDEEFEGKSGPRLPDDPRQALRVVRGSAGDLDHEIAGPEPRQGRRTFRQDLDDFDSPVRGIGE